MEISVLEPKIKELAKNKGVSIAKLCEKIGMSRNGFDTSLANASLKIGTLLKISEVLEVKVNYFFGENSDLPTVETRTNELAYTDAEKAKIRKIIAKKQKKWEAREAELLAIIANQAKH